VGGKVLVMGGVSIRLGLTLLGYFVDFKKYPPVVHITARSATRDQVVNKG
jgi:hypothetical protein